MATPRLRPVAPGERAKKDAPKTIAQAAESGSARDLLVAMRSRIAKQVDALNTPARDRAALTKRLIEVVRDIEAIDAAHEQDGDDDAEVEDGEFDASAV